MKNDDQGDLFKRCPNCGRLWVECHGNCIFSNARFNGSDYDPEKDDVRLRGQIQRIYKLMSDGHWRTLGEIEQATGDPPASISAQLRHLRKKRFGEHTVEKRVRGDREHGLFEYKLVV